VLLSLLEIFKSKIVSKLCWKDKTKICFIVLMIMFWFLQVLICECPKRHMIFCNSCEFLGKGWMPKHITIGLFETFETSRQTLARNLQEFLKQYELTKKIVVYVKDENVNMNTMTTIFKSIISCETLGVMESFQQTCFRNDFLRLVNMQPLKFTFFPIKFWL